MSGEWVDRLACLVRADFDTGKLYWRARAASEFPSQRSADLWNARYAGKEALTASDRHGYRVGQIDGRMMKAHRVIFVLANGFLPPEIDHKNRDPSDNRLTNLRAADRRGNCRNTGVARGSSLYRGVQRRGAKWAAKIVRERQQIYLGQFDCETDAARAYDAAAIEMHGDFASLNFPLEDLPERVSA